MKKAALIFGVGAILIFGIWTVVFPEPFITRLIENSLDNPEVRVEVTGLKKGLFYSFTSDQITVRKGETTLLSAEQIHGRINPLSLLILRLDMHFSGTTGGGSVSGGVDLFRGGGRLLLRIDKADLASIPLFPSAGINGTGVFSGSLELSKGKGEIRCDIVDARLASSSFGGVAVPLNIFRRARGAMSISSGVITVTSFTFEGKDIFARLKGNVSAGKLNLTMEVMPEHSFIERNPLFALLAPFKVSPGYYAIPVTSNLPF